MTAAELVAAIGRLRGGLDPARRDELAARLDLDLDRRMRDLSSGNRRKVALLLAFLADAELLVLDEPTSGLDPLVQRAADRVAVLRNGKVIALGGVEELRRRARHISPWDWALGGDPLMKAAAAWRYAILVMPAVLFALVGVVAFDRRDVRAA